MFSGTSFFNDATFRGKSYISSTSFCGEAIFDGVTFENKEAYSQHPLKVL